MSEAKNGGQVFPIELYTQLRSAGMTMRDYFAAKAMGIIPEQSAYNMKPNESNEQYVARRAYEYADAMLDVREKA